MSRESVLVESNDYLLGVGDPDHLLSEYADVVRELSLALPIWTTARTIVNQWSALRGAPNGSTTDGTALAQSAGMPVSTLVDGSSHLLGGSGKFDTVVYTILTPHSGGTPVYTYEYWNGLYFLPLVTVSTPDWSQTGVQSLVFILPDDVSFTPPVDMQPPYDDFDGVRFWVRVTATTAPTTTAAVATVQVRQHTWPLDQREQDIVALSYYPNDLTRTEIVEALDVTLPDWRTQVGPPRMYHQVEETALGVRLVPLPPTQGDPNGLLGFLPTAAVLTNNLVLCAAVTPEEGDIPPWLEGLVALRLAARESQRLGETSAPDLGKTLLQLTENLETMIRDVLGTMELR